MPPQQQLERPRLLLATTPAHRSRRRQSRSHPLLLSCPSVLPLLVLLLSCVAHPVRALSLCSNTTKDSVTVCRLELLLTRQPDCSVLVTERVVLRRSDNGSFTRVLSLTDGQGVWGVRHARQGVSAAVLVDECPTAQEWKNRRSLRLSTEETGGEVEHTLTYRMSGAVRFFSEPCAIRGDGRDYANTSHNVVQLRVGEWPQGIQTLYASYASPGRMIRAYGPDRKDEDVKNQTGKGTYEVGTEKDPAGTRNRDLYFVELNPPDDQRCTQLECLATANSAGSGGSSVSPGVIALLVIVALAIVALLFMFWARRRSAANDARLQQPIQALDDPPAPRRGPFGRRGGNTGGAGGGGGGGGGEAFPFGSDI